MVFYLCQKSLIELLYRFLTGPSIFLTVHWDFRSDVMCKKVLQRHIFILPVNFDAKASVIF